MKSNMVCYYGTVLTYTKPNREEVINIYDSSHPRFVSQEKNGEMVWNISIEEVETSIKIIPKIKGLGLGNFTNDFFRACCPIIGEDILETI